MTPVHPHSSLHLLVRAPYLIVLSDTSFAANLVFNAEIVRSFRDLWLRTPGRYKHKSVQLVNSHLS
ncbi:hypothetical protein QUB63_10645 [Microcoleus sp. ARI1-B5]|uniref:hypothetical protein n=1 Tax=unclassified Microcoleus TaxID=2642155 RepID=UPI002FCEBE0A